MIVTAFIDVLSHWCLAAQPALVALRTTLADDLTLHVRFTPVFDTGVVGLPVDVEAWCYTRGTQAYGTALDPSWYESESTLTWHANAAVAAGVALGAEPVALAGAVMHAAMRDGAPMGREDVVANFVAARLGSAADGVLQRMRSPELSAELHAANAALAAAGCVERPSWKLTNANGDHATLQGVWQAEAILPLVRAMLEDERAYARAGTPPALQSAAR